MSISRHQAAELRRRIEKALSTAWYAGKITSDEIVPDEDEVRVISDSEIADQRLFRYVDHLAKRKQR